ncbi:hypothetical protein CAEBREN_15049 [Caenorhabditis brenneri]|uniref:C-type lectin domain-containing protein n=1 Tax=Caenorhabditis brenneri TaxID=135651 RepID=G0NQM1_CAEBE|nr:hypothetical protein CAEBREN_15049 [Caenorhabditis brenneri]
MLLRASIFLLLLPSLVSSIFIKEPYGASDSESRERSYSAGRRYKAYGGGGRPPTCEEGWTFFQRPSGGWCMKVYPGNLNQYNSETMCVSKGAVLSGLQNIAEINWLISSALTAIAPQTSGGVWVGARRRPECIGHGITATCTKTNTFYWTDNSTTGIEGMIFQEGEPNNRPAPQNCALMTVATTPRIHALSYYYSGQMDDMICERADASWWPSSTLSRSNRAYVCGKKARR